MPVIQLSEVAGWSAAVFGQPSRGAAQTHPDLLSGQEQIQKSGHGEDWETEIMQFGEPRKKLSFRSEGNVSIVFHNSRKYNN